MPRSSSSLTHWRLRPILGHAAQVTAFLGQTGLPFLPRLLGVLLAVIAVQFILQGVEETVIRLLHQLR